MTINILAVGDVVGQTGLAFLKERYIRREFKTLRVLADMKGLLEEKGKQPR